MDVAEIGDRKVRESLERGTKPLGCRALREERRHRRTALTHATLTQRTPWAVAALWPPTGEPSQVLSDGGKRSITRF